MLPLKPTQLFLCLLITCISVNWSFSQPTNDFNIFRVHTKTGEVQQVSFIDFAGIFNPSFSPNGSKVVHDAIINFPFFHALVITDINTGVSELLDGGLGGNDASWSPNGQLIAFDRAPYGDPSIYTVPSEGGTAEFVKFGAIDPEWSNNNQKVVFEDLFTAAIKTIDINTGVETTVADFGFNPSWSPNGNFIAYDDNFNLFVVAVNPAGEPTGPPTQVTTDVGDIFNQQASWSNNSNTIVFHSNRGNTVFDFNIWTVDKNGGAPQLLTGIANNGDFDPAFSKNGKWVAYAGITPTLSPSINNTNEEFFTQYLDRSSSSLQNFPNPFSESTVIQFELVESDDISLQIFDQQGSLVRTLSTGPHYAGVHHVKWDGKNNNGQALPKGIYNYTLKGKDHLQTQRMILIK
jgi:Tol biopolymer transport system component